MGLKNKDGSPYQLAGPNPIMSQMSMWDEKNKLILHNIGGKKRMISYEDSKVSFRNSEPEIVSNLAAPAHESAKEEPKADPFDVPVSGEIPILPSLEEEKPFDIPATEKVQVWCLPAYFRQYKDDLYGETVNRVRYGDKFLFEAVLEEIGDLHLLLYTTTDSVTEGSILYPRTHDKRWWRVMSSERGEDGLIRLHASFTDYHPDFS